MATSPLQSGANHQFPELILKEETLNNSYDVWEAADSTQRSQLAPYRSQSSSLLYTGQSCYEKGIVEECLVLSESPTQTEPTEGAEYLQ